MPISISLKARLNPTTSALTRVYEECKANPKRMVFAEAEEDVVLRAAIQYRDFGYGTPILVGRTKAVVDRLHALGVDDPGSFEIENSALSEKVPAMVDYLYKRLQRKGYTQRDVSRMVNQERNVFAALLVALGHGDAMISGLTRTFSQTAREVNRVLDPKPGALPFGIHMMIGKHHTTFLADTTINERPTSAELAHIAKETAAVARRMGHEPRVAFLSYSTFGNPSGQWLANIRDAVAILDAEEVNFEYEGEMAPDAALNPEGDGTVSLQPPVRARQCADHAGPAEREPFGQAPARTGRRRHNRPDAGGNGKTGPDRPDDGHRARPSYPRGAGGGRCCRLSRISFGKT